MIRYTLQCADGHRFESWFQSAEAFEKLHTAGMVSCAVCGGSAVEKTLMAPNIGSKSDSKDDKRPLSTPASPAEQALAELKRHVEANSDYVGGKFADEARKMHSGEAPERAIWGEAKLGEAKALIEEGVPVAPLPFTPTRKSN